MPKRIKKSKEEQAAVNRERTRKYRATRTAIYNAQFPPAAVPIPAQSSTLTVPPSTLSRPPRDGSGDRRPNHPSSPQTSFEAGRSSHTTAVALSTLRDDPLPASNQDPLSASITLPSAASDQITDSIEGPFDNIDLNRTSPRSLPHSSNTAVHSLKPTGPSSPSAFIYRRAAIWAPDGQIDDGIDDSSHLYSASPRLQPVRRSPPRITLTSAADHKVVGTTEDSPSEADLYSAIYNAQFPAAAVPFPAQSSEPTQPPDQRPETTSSIPDSSSLCVGGSGGGSPAPASTDTFPTLSATSYASSVYQVPHHHHQPRRRYRVPGHVTALVILAIPLMIALIRTYVLRVFVYLALLATGVEGSV